MMPVHMNVALRVTDIPAILSVSPVNIRTPGIRTSTTAQILKVTTPDLLITLVTTIRVMVYTVSLSAIVTYTIGLPSLAVSFLMPVISIGSVRAKHSQMTINGTLAVS